MTQVLRSAKTHFAMNTELKRQRTSEVKYVSLIECDDLNKLYQSFDIQDPVS